LLMSQDFEWKSVSIKKDSFNTKNNPFIITWSKADIDALNEKQKMYWNATLPIIINDMEIPKISKLIAKRFAAKLNWMPQNVVNQIYWLLPSERQSKERVEYFINEDVMPKWIFKDPNFDYNTLWIYLQKAEETSAKHDLLKVLERYLIEQWQWLQVPQMNEQANTASNIMMGQASQNQWQSDIVSKQDVLNPTRM
jgi:hypothetical protein